MKKSFLAPLLLVAALAACGPAPKELPPVRATGTADALTVELLAPDALHVGQNYVRYRVTQSGAPVTRATLAQKPMMDMGTMKHACPLQNPALEADADGLFDGLLVFSMPTVDMGKWTLDLEVTRDGETTPVKVSLGELTIADSTLKQVVTRDGKKIVLTVGFAEKPHVGTNTIVVTAHSAKDMMMMEYVPVTDLAFTLTPEMPSMGHGSSGNLAPTLKDDQLYRGTVNFSMAGDWVVHLGVATGDTTHGTFDFPFDL
ncbi:MAG: FixH family protein [Myxococcota bacterium]